jgi:hypothetical protein
MNSADDSHRQSAREANHYLRNLIQGAVVKVASRAGIDAQRGC